MEKLLVVVDMQNDFISGSLGSSFAEGIVENVCKKIENFDGDIVYTSDTHNDDYFSTVEGQKLPVVHCKKDTFGWKLDGRVESALQKKHGVLVFYKETFGSVDLANYAKANGYGEITLIGLCTDVCVISNAILLKAFLPNAKIIVDSSCTAGVTCESHKTALDAMKAVHIDII